MLRFATVSLLLAASFAARSRSTRPVTSSPHPALASSAESASILIGREVGNHPSKERVTAKPTGDMIQIDRGTFSLQKSRKINSKENADGYFRFDRVRHESSRFAR
jgi:hypothetical protein